MAKIGKRVNLLGSERTLLPGSRKIGPADPGERIQVTVFLRRGSSPKQSPAANKIGKLPPTQRRHLSRAQFASRHGARPADIKKIRAFATQNGLKVVEASRARRSVLLSGSVGAFSHAFGVELNSYDHPGGGCRMRSGAIQIPAALNGIIEGVSRPRQSPASQAAFPPTQEQTNPARSPTPQTFPTRHCKSRKRTLSRPAPTAPGNASASCRISAADTTRRSHPVFQQSRNLRAQSHRRFRRRRQKFAHRRRQRPRRRSGTRYRSRRSHRARRTNRHVFRAEYRSRLLDAITTAVHDATLQAIHHFHQLGRPGRFLDGPIAQRTQFRLRRRINHGRHRPRSFGR